MPPKKILLVDDDLSLLDGVGDRLRSYGLKVRCEATAAGCFSALSQEVPDLVLLDIQLPDGNGLDLLSHIRAHHPALPVLMVSSVRGVEKEALRRGATGFLAKPFRGEDLKQAVLQALRETG